MSLLRMGIKSAFHAAFCGFLLASLPLAASDSDAQSEQRDGANNFKSGNYREAASNYMAAALYADDTTLKANSLKEAAKAYAKTEYAYKEFECLEKLINGFPSHIDYPAAVNREFELGNKFFAGHRDPAFRWFPWIPGENRTIEIYERALAHGPYAKDAAEAKLRLARLYIDADRSQDGLRALREVISMYPDTDQQKYAYFELANALVYLSQHGDGDGTYGREAREILAKIREKYTKDPELPWVDKALTEADDASSKRLYGLADFYHRRGNDEAAARYLSDSIKEYPDAKHAGDSEEMLSSLDSSFKPAARPQKPRLPFKYDIKPMEEEERIVITTPENSGGKWLLPIDDLGVSRRRDISREKQE
ncbi:MAG: hypothetical protein A2X49_02285 [Lentisphaerae bacterium GWF2_52_8]|nr:MAG: hypothetical protein A2X49_02285 [Lentisphaerae bacterium GWF2_52_8]